MNREDQIDSQNYIIIQLGVRVEIVTKTMYQVIQETSKFVQCAYPFVFGDRRFFVGVIANQVSTEERHVIFQQESEVRQ